MHDNYAIYLLYYKIYKLFKKIEKLYMNFVTPMVLHYKICATSHKATNCLVEMTSYTKQFNFVNEPWGENLCSSSYNRETTHSFSEKSIIEYTLTNRN